MKQNFSNFRKEVRMSREAFFKLREMLKDQPEYKYKGVGHRQMPCEVQLMIALNRLGSSGNGGSYSAVARRYSISGKKNIFCMSAAGILTFLVKLEGQVKEIMKRFITAMMKFCTEFVKWPTGADKKNVIEKHRERSGFTGCVGFVDGSLLSLHEKPCFEPQNFFNRKKQYMVSSTVVCDYDLRIIYAQVGDFGSTHDARSIREGALGKNVDKLFSPRQFILGDGAYPERSWLLPVQRNYKRSQLSGSDIKFNKCISRMRVRIENCFAALKGRFPNVDQH